jgi:uncharacterized alpha-E superfamily protein
MLARVANLTYWTSRQLERAENSARILEVNGQLALDVQRAGRNEDPSLWEPVVYTCGSEELFRKLYGLASERNVTNFVLFDRENPSSVRSCISQARENARCIREQITSEMWEQLNAIHLKLRTDDYEAYQATGAFEYLSRLKTSIHSFYGICESMYPHIENWQWLQLGRYLERADNVSRIIDVKYFTLLPRTNLVGHAFDILQWAAVLRSCSAFEAYRRMRHGPLSLESVLDYLILEPTFPRSILFSLEAALKTVREISRSPSGNAATAALDAALAELRQTTPKRILTEGLHEFLDRIQIRVGEAHNAVFKTYIDYPVETV